MQEAARHEEAEYYRALARNLANAGGLEATESAP